MFILINLNRRIATPTSNRLSRGQSLVEFALLLPLLIVILIGILDLGRFFGGYVALTNAAREGARYAIDYPTDTTGIKNRTVSEVSGSLPNFTTSNVTVNAASGTDPGNPITVAVSYPFPLITTYLFGGLQNIPINTSATMQIE